jgi:hypothetical protein
MLRTIHYAGSLLTNEGERLMKFSTTRKALSGITGTRLRQDIETVLATIEKSAKTDMDAAGKRTTHLIGLVFALRNTIPPRSRFSIVNAIFNDAAKGEVPHQWERKEGFECGPKNDCTKPNQDTTCYRDTSGPSCASG